MINRDRKFFSFSDILRFHARERPEKIFLHNGVTDKDYTFGQIDKLVDKAVSLLLKKGCQKKDIISTVLDNRLDYIILFFASIRLGTIFNPFPFNLGAQDVLKYLRYIRPRIVFCQEKHRDALRSPGRTWSVELVTDTGEENAFLEKLKVLKKTHQADFLPEDADEACIYYSSGTTGNPKGVVYSHRNMVTLISSLARGFGFTEDTCHLVMLPLGHTAAVNYSLLPCMYCGGTMALFESFWKIRSDIWKHIEKFNVSYMEVVPSVLFSMLNTPYKGYDRKKLRRFNYIGCGSAPLPVDIQRKMESKFGLKVANLYGLSETGPTHFDNPLEAGWQPGSIGRALDVNDVKIFDETAKEAGVGRIGEIAVKGPNVFVGYFNNKRAYGESFKNGYFMTGDLGYKDEKDIFYFSDRKKDLIIKGGVNIFPGEIDEIIFSHPAIKEALTVGVSHPYLGERIKSYIVVKDGVLVSEGEIRSFCHDKLGDFKCPDEFVFADNIPKGATGKLLRKALRKGDIR